MTYKYPERLGEISSFKVMTLLARARELQSQGHDVVQMEVGEPDFDTPGVILEAGLQALRKGKTRYTPANGLMELRELISSHYLREFGVSISADQIFVTAGASGALLLALACTMDAGDELLMTDPGYPCYRHMLTSQHARAGLIPVSANSGYQLTARLVEEYYGPRTRGVLLASPANPTGAVISRNELESISSCVSKRSGCLLVDEIYQGLIYQNHPVSSAADLGDHVFVANSFSKYFGMTGWRLGWLVVPKPAISIMEKLAQNLFICASSIAQEAAIAAFTPEAKEQMEKNKKEFQKRRDYLVPALQALGFEIPLLPDGAFYIYARLPAGSPKSEVFCTDLLENHYVSVTPGTDFGVFEADNHVRFSYAQSVERLQTGVERIAKALAVSP